MKIQALKTTYSSQDVNFKGNYSRFIQAKCNPQVHEALNLIKAPMEFLAKLSPADFMIVESRSKLNGNENQFLCSIKFDGEKSWQRLSNSVFFQNTTKTANEIAEATIRKILAILKSTRYEGLYKEVENSVNVVCQKDSSLRSVLIEMLNAGK